MKSIYQSLATSSIISIHIFIQGCQIIRSQISPNQVNIEEQAITEAVICQEGSCPEGTRPIPVCGIQDSCPESLIKAFSLSTLKTTYILPTQALTDVNQNYKHLPIGTVCQEGSCPESPPETAPIIPVCSQGSCPQLIQQLQLDTSKNIYFLEKTHEESTDVNNF